MAAYRKTQITEHKSSLPIKSDLWKILIEDVLII